MTPSKLEESIERLSGYIAIGGAPKDHLNARAALRAFAEAVREKPPEPKVSCKGQTGQVYCNDPDCGDRDPQGLHFSAGDPRQKPPEPNRKCGSCGAPNCQKDGHWFECKPPELPAEVRGLIDSIVWNTENVYLRPSLESLARLCLWIRK